MEEVQKEIAQQKADIDNFLAKEGLLTFRGIDGFETEQLSIVTNRLADATQRRIAAESLEKAVSAGAGSLWITSFHYRRSLTMRKFRICVSP